MNQKIHSIDDALTALELTNEQWNKEWFEITDSVFFNYGIFLRLCDDIRYVGDGNREKLIYLFKLFSLQVLWPEDKKELHFHCDETIIPTQSPIFTFTSLSNYRSGADNFIEKFDIYDEFLRIISVCKDYIYNSGRELIFSEESKGFRSYLLYFNWLLIRIYVSHDTDNWLGELCYLPIRNDKKEGLFQILHSNSSETRIRYLLPSVINNFMLNTKYNSILKWNILSHDVKTIFTSVKERSRADSLAIAIDALTNYYKVKKTFTPLDFEAVHALFNTTLHHLYRDTLIVNICTCYMDHIKDDLPKELYAIYNTFVNTIENEPNKYLEIGRQIELKSRERETREAQEQLDKEQLIERVSSLF